MKIPETITEEELIKIIRATRKKQKQAPAAIRLSKASRYLL